ncbi:hypothetical protein KC320_g6 [Hortaea werneckii]|nr:hypothetical protein KC320_g6 [Hortaea werneckii]
MRSLSNRSVPARISNFAPLPLRNFSDMPLNQSSHQGAVALRSKRRDGGFGAPFIADRAGAQVPLDRFVDRAEHFGPAGEVGAHVLQGFDGGAFNHVDDGVPDDLGRDCRPIHRSLRKLDHVQGVLC